MIWTLTFCSGMFLGICGHYHRVEFLSERECTVALDSVNKAAATKWAYCKQEKKL